MDNDVERAIRSDLDAFHLPRFRDVPDVGLMLEQTARLVNGYLEPLGSIHLTSSMISNYVKQGIITRPVRKLYYREQIASLIFIAVAKTALPLDDIKRMLLIQREVYEPAAAYDCFCAEFEQAIQRICLSGGEADDSHREAPVLKEMLVRLVSTTAHQIHLEKYVRLALGELESEQG